MLRTLHIENIAVIKCVDIAFDAGLTVLTGETGAGKSILIDSVGLLLGGKFSREIIRTGETSASVSAVFDQLSRETVEALCDLGYAGLSLKINDTALLPEGIIGDLHERDLRVCLRAADTREKLREMIDLGLDYQPSNCVFTPIA